MIAPNWMLDQSAMVEGVHSALKPGARFLAEMGGDGNIAAIRAAVSVKSETFGIDAQAA